MVLINGVKYACERCIRGHRVTTCSHTDHPMVMVKPKGRPSTTCAYCKELRKKKYANPVGTCTCKRQGKLKQLQREKDGLKSKTNARGKTREKLKGSTVLDMGRRPGARATKKGTVTAATTTKTTTMAVGAVAKDNVKLNGSSSKEGSDGSLSSLQECQKPSFRKPMTSTSLEAADFIVAGPPPVISPATSFIDGNPALGQYTTDHTKMYPMAVQNNSRRSSQSLKQYFSAPQSPSSFSVPGSLLTTYDSYSGMASPFDSSAINENDFGSLANVGRAWSLNINNNIDNDIAYCAPGHPLMDHVQRSFSVGYNAGSNNHAGLGEVIVPLDEYVPTNLNGVGRVTGRGLEFDAWTLEDDPNMIGSIPLHSTVKNEEKNLTKSIQGLLSSEIAEAGGLLDEFLDPSSMYTLTRASSLLHHQNGDEDENAGGGGGGGGGNNTDTAPISLEATKNTAANLDCVGVLPPVTAASEVSNNPCPVEVLTVTASFADIPDDKSILRSVPGPGTFYASEKLPHRLGEVGSVYTLDDSGWKNGSVEQFISPNSPSPFDGVRGPVSNSNVNGGIGDNIDLLNNTDPKIRTGIYRVSVPDLPPLNSRKTPGKAECMTTPTSTSTTPTNFSEQLPPNTNMSMDMAMSSTTGNSSYQRPVQIPLLPGQNFADLDSLMSTL